MREIDKIFIPLKKLHSGNVQQNMDVVVVLAVSSLRSDTIQHRKWRRLREMHMCSTPTAPPPRSSEMWWSGRTDRRHDSVVLWWRVSTHRASPARGSGRERGGKGVTAKVWSGGGRHPCPLYIGAGSRSAATKKTWGASLPPPSRLFP
jgi:hypothetical protein